MWTVEVSCHEVGPFFPTLQVDFIHKKGKVNRDIKLSNVLIVESGPLPLIKIHDFSMAKDK